MSGQRVAGGRRKLDDFVRLACSTDPRVPPRRPRRAAMAPRAAMILGALLVGLALVLALRTVTTAPSSDDEPARSASGAAVASGRASGPATGGASPSQTAVLEAGPGAGDAQGEVVVHVAGAVGRPGIVRLPAGARVADAIDAAGGAREEADTDRLNLARPVSDGEQVRVPALGEQIDAVPAASQPPAAAGTAGSAGGAGRPININTASASELEGLPGIGPALAERIVSHRQTNGPFKSVDDLENVPGIGRAKLEALRTEATV